MQDMVTHMHENEDEMLEARKRDHDALMRNHNENLEGLPPFSDDILKQAERQKLLVSACRNYKRLVREMVERHQREEDALREHLSSPPADVDHHPV